MAGEAVNKGRLAAGEPATPSGNGSLNGLMPPTGDGEVGLEPGLMRSEAKANVAAIVRRFRQRCVQVRWSGTCVWQTASELTPI